MLNLRIFKCNPLEENCYIIWPKKGSNSCIIIDFGAWRDEESEKIFQFLESEGLIPTHHLITHGHFDHIWGAFSLYERYGLRPEMLSAEQKTYENASKLLESLIPGAPKLVLPPHGELFDDGQVLNLGGSKDKLGGSEENLGIGEFTCQVIGTPGHTPGGCCFYFKEAKLLVSGDTLFRHSYGRTDFPGGSSLHLYESLKRLMELPEDTRVLPGHGEETTIGEERYLI